MTETQLTAKLVKRLNKNPAVYARKMQTTIPGFPDMVFGKEGIVRFIECKAAKKPQRKTTKVLVHKLTERQKFELNRLAESGTPCGVLLFIKVETKTQLFYIPYPVCMGVNDMRFDKIFSYLTDWELSNISDLENPV